MKVIPFDIALKSTKPQDQGGTPVIFSNDQDSVEFRFTVTDMTASELSGAVGEAYLSMRDGSFFPNDNAGDVELEGTTFIYKLKENEGNHVGNNDIQLRVHLSGKKYASPIFKYKNLRGLDDKAAMEILVPEWNQITAEARAYVQQMAEWQDASTGLAARFDAAMSDMNNITYDKTDFLGTGKNLFDRTKIQDKYVKADGTMADSTYFHTDFIPIKNGQSIAFLGSNRGERTARFTAFYDASKKVLPQYGSDTGTRGPITATGAEIAYVVLSFQRIYLDGGLDLMIEYGTTNSNYETFRLLPTEKVRLSDVQKTEVAGLVEQNSPRYPITPLSKKSLGNFGDSVAAGDGNAGKGYAEIIAEDYGMVVVDYAMGGATVTKSLNPTNNIVTQVDTAVADTTKSFDYILVDGRTNDLNSTYTSTFQLGTVTAGKDTTTFAYDLATFSGSLEYIFAKLRTRWPNAKILFVSVHNMGSRDVAKQKLLHDRSVEIADKWSVGLADLYSPGLIDTTLAENLKYTNPTAEQPAGDKTHPNELGYRNFYVPVILDELLRTAPEVTLDSDVVLARDKEPTLDARLDRDYGLLDGRVKQSGEVMATNIVNNGDFSKGTEGWTSSNLSSMYAENGTLVSVASVLGAYPLQRLSTNIGDQYYVSVDLKTTAPANKLRLTIAPSSVWNSGTTAYERLSLLFKATNTNAHMFTVVDVRDSGFDPFYLKYAKVINLTETFGAGNEPTKGQMDELLSQFPNSWFDGTANLFRAKDMLNRQVRIDQRTEFEVANVIVNGDFSNGTTKWLASGGTVSVANNTGIFTSTASNQITGVIQQGTKLLAFSGKKVYVRYKIRVTNSECTEVGLFLFGSIGGGLSNPTRNPVANTWYTSSAIFDVSSFAGEVNFKLQHVYATAEASINKVMEFQYASMIDLTSTFGAGKEPTLAEMDRLMARYPNGWFDGKQPVQTIETLYQEKANKKQEDWFYPTLVNGATSATENLEDRFAIMKDEFGFVHFKGSVNSVGPNTVVTILPKGYKGTSVKRKRYVCPTAVGNDYRTVLIYDSEVWLTGNAATISLDSIVYKAEG